MYILNRAITKKKTLIFDLRKFMHSRIYNKVKLA
jgi:hypothetical protein